MKPLSSDLSNLLYSKCVRIDLPKVAVQSNEIYQFTNFGNYMFSNPAILTGRIMTTFVNQYCSDTYIPPRNSATPNEYLKSFVK